MLLLTFFTAWRNWVSTSFRQDSLREDLGNKFETSKLPFLFGVNQVSKPLCFARVLLSVSSRVWYCRIFARQNSPAYLSMVQVLMTSRRASWVIAGLLPLVLLLLLKHLSWKRYLCHKELQDGWKGASRVIFLRVVWATLIVAIKNLKWKISALVGPFSERHTLEWNTVKFRK